MTVPSAVVKPFALSRLVILVMVAASLLPAALVTRVAANDLGTTIPGHCIEHTTFSDGDDASDDYRCAGIAIEFHTAGVENSPFPIWAGQWLFRDPSSNFRVGSCTFNRGVHPNITSPSRWVAQSFPNDPGGERAAYLAWKYGDTTDNLIAAGLWAVFHYYAQDAAGPNRATDPNAPLVPTLGGVGAASGRPDLQATAIALHNEADQLVEPWTLSLAVGADGVATATLVAGANPVPDQPISVLVSGLDAPLVAITGTDGSATVTVLLPLGTVTVVATAAAPGPADTYRGQPASDNGQGAQTLITGGVSRLLRTEVLVEVAPAAPPTTEPPTTTTSTEAIAPTTEAVIPTTEPTTEVTGTTAEPVIAELTTAPPTTTAPGQLPRTGGGGDMPVAYLGTAFVVGGVGLIGTLRRRRSLT